jgi:hypothetical protein
MTQRTPPLNNPEPDEQDVPATPGQKDPEPGLYIWLRDVNNETKD